MGVEETEYALDRGRRRIKPVRNAYQSGYKAVSLGLGCDGVDSNHRPSGYEPAALPLSYPSTSAVFPAVSQTFGRLPGQRHPFWLSVSARDLAPNFVMVHKAGFEPATSRISGALSTTELLVEAPVFPGSHRYDSI